MSIKNTTNRPCWPVIGIVGAAALLRLLLLGLKPPHFDEGVNGWFIDEMTKHGFYHYDPSNYHGPLHFYLLFLFHSVMGRSIWALRLPVVLISILSVFWVTKFDRFFGRRACLFAALAMALSPGMVFYGRYAIHESELVFFLMLMTWGFAGLWQFGERKYLWALGLGFTGTILTKETYFIHLACFILAAGTLWLFEKLSPSAPLPRAIQLWKGRDLAAVVAAGAGLILFFYSGGFLDPVLLSTQPVLIHNSPVPVPGFLINTFWSPYAAWFQTGTNGNGHEKTSYDLLTLHFTRGSGENARVTAFTLFNYYWIALITRYEWITLAGLAGLLRLLWPNTNRLIRFIAIYGTGTLAAYSLVPYKTPWCIITLIWPFFFVFGYLCDGLSRRMKLIFLPLVSLLCIATLLQTARLNFFHYTDEDEPYVYVQTLNDINKLTDPLFKLVAGDPSACHLAGHIILSSYHPIPWLLGDFTAVGYYSADTLPPVLDADFLLVDGSRVSEIEKMLKNRYFTAPLKLRGSQDPAKLYLSFEKFSGIFPEREPEFKPKSGDEDPTKP